MRNKERVCIALFTLVCVCQISPVSYAQGSDSGGETNEQLKRLEDKKKEVQLRADIQEAEQRVAEATVAAAKADAGETRPLDGSVTLNDGAGYFSEILAYRSLHEAAMAIANDIASKRIDSTKKIIVFEKLDLAAENAMWELTYMQIVRLSTRQQEFLSKYSDDKPDLLAFAAPAVDLSSAISSVADLVGYLREDTTLSTYEIELNEQALVALVAAELKHLEPTREIVIPARSMINKGPLLSEISTLAEQRTALLERLLKIQAADAESDYAKMAKQEIESVTKAVADLIEELTTSPQEGMLAPLQALALVDNLRTYGDDMFLYVGIAGQGGEVQITKSIWTGGRISYIGGSTSVYFLTDALGALYAAGTSSKYLKGWYGQRAGVSKLQVE